MAPKQVSLLFKEIALTQRKARHTWTSSLECILYVKLDCPLDNVYYVAVYAYPL